MQIWVDMLLAIAVYYWGVNPGYKQFSYYIQSSMHVY